MSDQRHPTEDVRGWGYGLATWVLAAYTAEGDIVLDVDADPGIRVAAETMNRAYFTGIAVSSCARVGGFAGVRLVTAHLPRSTAQQDLVIDDHSAEREAFADLAALLVPGAWLALVVSLPVPTQPFTVRTGQLLAAAHAEGLGHPRRLHVVAASDGVEGEPAYRCAIVFRRAGRRTDRSGGPSAGRASDQADG